MRHSPANSKFIRDWIEAQTLSKKRTASIASSLVARHRSLDETASLEEVVDQCERVLDSFDQGQFGQSDWCVYISFTDLNVRICIVRNSTIKVEVVGADVVLEKQDIHLNMAFGDFRRLVNFDEDLMSIMMRTRRIDKGNSPTIRPLSDLFFGAYNLYHLPEHLRDSFIAEVYEDGKVSNLQGYERHIFPWGISADIGDALYQLIIQQKSKRSLEIGLAYGMSALFFTYAHFHKGYGHHTAVDPCQSVEFQSIGYDQIKKAGLDDQFRLLEAKDYEVLPDLVKAGERFDFIFIDGLHMHDYVMIDFFYCDLLLEEGGIVVFDDCILPGVGTAVAYVDENRQYEYLDEYSCSRYRAYRKIGDDVRSIGDPNYHKEYFSKSIEILGRDNQLHQVNISTSQPMEADAKSGLRAAILGLDGLFPGDLDVEGLWRSIDDEQSCYQPNSTHNLYDRNERVDQRTANIVSGIVSKAFEFDPEYFKISPAEAERIDPQLRHLLMSCQRSLADAGLSSEILADYKVGVFVGAEGSDYADIHKQRAIDDGYILNYSGSVLAHRISHAFDFNGPSEVINTMCSSAACGITRALELLRSGQIDYALVGAAKFNFSDMGFASLEELNITTANAQCYSFHELSKGYIRSEGVATVLLCREDLAQREGHRSYGFIKEAAINYSGKDGHSMFAPSKRGQRSAMMSCIKKAQIDPAQLRFIEAQGMGNEISDFVEFTALNEAWDELTECNNSRAAPVITTGKPLLGHMECVSTMGALFRVLHAFQHNKVSKIPKLNTEKIHAGLDHANRQCQLLVEDLVLEEDTVHTAGLNAFGASGTNVFLLIDSCDQRQEFDQALPDFLPFAAHNTRSLQAYLRNFARFIDNQSGKNELLQQVHMELSRSNLNLSSRALVRVDANSPVNQLIKDLILAAENQYCENIWDNAPDSKNHLSKEHVSQDTTKLAVDHTYLQWLNGEDFSQAREVAITQKSLRLPSYCFDLDHYKLPLPLSTTQSDWENVSDVEEIKFRIRLSGDEYFLQDHRVNDQKILPAVVYLDWVRKAVQQAINDSAKSLILKDLVWQSPCIVDGGGSILILLSTGKTVFDFEVRDDKTSSRLCFGSVSLDVQQNNIIDDMSILDSQHIQENMKPAELYQHLQKLGVSHGQRMQCIQSIGQVGDNLQVKLAREYSNAKEDHGFTMWPSMLDSAFQSVLAFSSNEESLPNKPAIPFALNSLEFYRPFTGVMYALIRYSQNDVGENRPRMSFDMTLVNEKGERCAELRGLNYRHLSGELNALARDRLTKVHEHEFFGDMHLLDAHKIGLPVLMGAAYVASMVQHASANTAENAVALANIRFERPLVLPSGNSAKVSCYIDENTHYVCRACKSNESIEQKYAVAMLEKVRDEQPSALESEKWISEAIWHRSGDDFYLAEKQFFYGKALHSVKDVWASQDGRILARASISPEVADECQSWDLPPPVIDSCSIAMNFALAGEHQSVLENMGLPIGIDFLQLFAKAADLGLHEFWCEISQFEKTADVAKADATVYNHLGEPILQIRGLTSEQESIRNRAELFSESPKIDQTISEVKPVQSSTLEKARQTIIQVISDELKINEGKLSIDAAFADLGVDSITGVNAIKRINEALGVQVEITSLFEHSTVKALSNKIAQLMEQHSSNENMETSEAENQASESSSLNKVGYETINDTVVDQKSPITPAQGPIAIIGVSGRFPQSTSLDEFWRALKSKNSLAQQSPRWPAEMCSVDSRETGCRHGGFLTSIDGFDARFFGIKDEEACYMDPQQRIFLEEAWTALEDAGYVGDAVDGQAVGVYLACGDSHYDTLLDKNSPGHAFWGNSKSVAAARIAYHLNLHGPAIVIDSACSSSAAALHLACQSLWSKECSMALAGGVFVQATPGFFQASNNAGMLSTKGECRAFDSEADGMIPGEAAAAVVLKPLDQAITDGDNIHGIIAASGLNQNGHSNGLVSPNGQAQRNLILSTYERFGIDASTIDFIETHGTGTALGDAIELSVLRDVFAKKGEPQSIAIGSVKSHIGHSASAAGIASLLKVLLALKHEQMPPIANFNKLNPAVNLNESPLYVNEGLKPWARRSQGLRRSAISSFGFNGTNAHLVIEEAPPEKTTSESPNIGLVLLSAKSKNALHQRIEDLASVISARDINLTALCHTLACGREHMAHRTAFVVEDLQELRSLLNRWISDSLDGRVELAHVEKVLPEQKEHSELISQYLKDYRAVCEFGKSDSEEKEASIRKKLEAIEGYFLQGYSIPFRQMYPKAYPRVALPTYPFEHKSYWLESNLDSELLTKDVPAQASDMECATPGSSDLQELYGPEEMTIKLISYFKLKLSRLVDLDPESISNRINYFDLGITSLELSQLISEINEELGIEIWPSMVFEHREIDLFVEFLVVEFGEQLALVSSEKKLKTDSKKIDWESVAQGELGANLGTEQGTHPLELIQPLTTDGTENTDNYEKLTF